MTDHREDRLLERAIDELRRPVSLSDDFDAEVMAGVKRPGAFRLGVILRSLGERRVVAVSPIGMIGAAAVIAGVAVGGAALFARLLTGGVTREAAVVTDESRDVQVVRFVLAAPGAGRVNLVGDFNGWDADATPLRLTGSGGVWIADVPLRRGRHEYAFLIDGHEWRPDPAAPRAPTNDYDTPNSAIIVGAQAT
ncbi:MAG TPA: isoamylase early set domain-containing protein [Gemmatimonadales bacterium]|nr:isoamylase early set domain-containing protein [Gemmatimonadales bacterium]